MEAGKAAEDDEWSKILRQCSKFRYLAGNWMEFLLNYIIFIHFCLISIRYPEIDAVLQEVF